MRSPHFLIFTFLFFCAAISHAQVIKGTIEDEKGNPIPYATIYVKELSQGITSTENGEFELSVPAGNYTCMFRSLGYEMLTQEISVNKQSAPLKIMLPEKMYELQAVNVSLSREDPAYGIMRRAIGMAPHYNQLVKEYIADLYVKGSFKVGKIGGLVGFALDRKTKKALSNSSGMVESVNEIHFTAPNNFKQRVKSQQQAFSFDLKELGFDINDINVGLMIVNIYNPDLKILSPRSFAEYKYRYEGCFREGERLINKIKVIPKYKRNELYSGYIYIVEDEWCVHSIDLTQTRMGLDFRLEQQYGEVSENIFLPVSSKAELDGKAMGIQLSGRYNNSIKYSLVVPNEKLVKTPAKPNDVAPQTVAAVPPKKENPKKEKIEKELSTLMEKEELSSRDMRKAVKIQNELLEINKEEEREERGEKKTLEVQRRSNYEFVRDSAAMKSDTAFWATMRPVPLAKEELVTLKKQDSINLVRAGMPADTTAKGKRNRALNLISDLVLGGRTFRIDSTLSITYNGLLDMNTFDFSTVDGYVVGQSAYLVKRFSDNRSLRFDASAAYALSRETFLWNAKLQHRYFPQRRAVWSIEGGHRTADFAGERSIGKINMYSSMLWRVNYSMFYDSRYVKASNTIDLANGLRLFTEASYENARQEINHSDYSFFHKDSREYRPNIPRNAQVIENPNLLADDITFSTTIGLSYTPQYFYRMRGKQKIMMYSHYPTFNLRWTRGWTGVFDSNSDFDLLSFNINQRINIHSDAVFSYDISAGKFFNNENVAFHNFRHFNSNEAGVSFSTITQPYQLLPMYTYSTNDWYVTANANYSARYMALKYIPFFANTLMNENLSVSYLLTPQIRHYTEFGYGLTNIYFFGDIGVFVGFEENKYYGWGVRAAINLDNLR